MLTTRCFFLLLEIIILLSEELGNIVGEEIVDTCLQLLHVVQLVQVLQTECSQLLLSVELIFSPSNLSV